MRAQTVGAALPTWSPATHSYTTSTSGPLVRSTRMRVTRRVLRLETDPRPRSRNQGDTRGTPRHAPLWALPDHCVSTPPDPTSILIAKGGDQDRDRSHLMHLRPWNSSDGFQEVAPDAEGMAVGRSADDRARRREAERQRRERTARRGTTDQSAEADAPAHTSADGGCPAGSRCVLRLVRRCHHATFSGAHPEVVLGRLPTPRLGAGPCGDLRAVSCGSGRAPGRGARAGHAHATGLGAASQRVAHQVEDGRVYDRDLAALAAALTIVLEAYSRRPYVRDRSFGRGSAPLW
ncbi:hypothetical protein SAMN06893097_103236 [Geodermatophilus sabuli]|uniref:Uncharacterized protein n=1 Tax=Geodermatophilus sabuli TaxID=1564158 RepID=A0A285EAQ0_9ACTN|nr:hypothetical protein SAMN06893097_103236 [Geodermatophilus sabuli]